MTATELEMADFLQFDYDEQIDIYQFEGKNYTDSTVIKEILLQRKKEDV